MRIAKCTQISSILEKFKEMTKPNYKDTRRLLILKTLK